MRLDLVEITNIKAISYLKFEVGAVTVLLGTNEQGKSSVLDAIKSVFEGGHDPNMIRHGAEKGIIRFVIDDGTVITKTITAKDSYLEVRTADGGVKPAPATYLKSLAQSFAFDPMGLIDCPPKKRGEFLLKHGNVSFSAAEVNQALGVPTVRGDIDLAKLEEIRTGKYSERTEVNRKVRDLDGSIREQRKMLPPDGEQNWAAEQARIEALLAQARESASEKQREVGEGAAEICREAREAAQKEIDAIRERLASQIEEINRKTAELMVSETASLHEQITNLSAELAGARAKADEQKRAEGVRSVIAKNEKQYKENLSLAGALDRTIEALDNLKLSKFRELPIEGLDIRDGDIWINGVPWEHLNTQTQIFISIQCADMGKGKLPLMVCDKFESVAKEKFEHLAAAVAHAGLQLITARVDAGPLRVEVAA